MEYILGLFVCALVGGAAGALLERRKWQKVTGVKRASQVDIEVDYGGGVAPGPAKR